PLPPVRLKCLLRRSSRANCNSRPHPRNLPSYKELIMDLRGKKITVHDMCLRDGMHPKRHQISLQQMKNIACGLDAAGVPLIEVTHGDGLGGSSVNYGFPAHTDEQYLSAVIPMMKQAKVSALLLPGIGTV